MFSLLFITFSQSFPNFECNILFPVSQAQGNSSDNSEDKDTDALKDNVPEEQNEACEQTSETDR